MNSLITIASYTNSLQANIVKGRLQAEGIPATLANEQYINMYWLISNALGGVQVQVPPAYEKNAIEVIESIENGQFEEGENWKKEDQLLCSQCGSSDIKKARFFWKLSLLLTHFFHLPLPFSQHAYHCKSCQHEWSEEDEKEYSTGTILLYITLWGMFFGTVMAVLFLIRSSFG